MSVMSEIIEAKIRKFSYDYLNLSRSIFTGSDDEVTHPGEFGRFRERLIQNILSDFIPLDFRISDGFIANVIGEVSSQCDCVIYDGDVSIIRNEYNQCFFFAESVHVIGEAKSILARTSLRDALQKLAKIKAMILESRTSESKTNYRYQPLSFLVCESFDFILKPDDIGFLYDGIDKLYWHNMLLSLKDGLYTYYIHKENGSNTTIHYPVICQTEFKCLRVYDARNIIPVALFLSYIFQHLNSCHRECPDLCKYLPSREAEKIEYEE